MRVQVFLVFFIKSLSPYVSIRHNAAKPWRFFKKDDVKCNTLHISVSYNGILYVVVVLFQYLIRCRSFTLTKNTRLFNLCDG